MICWGMRERGRPQHSKFPATKLNEAGVFGFQKQRDVGLCQPIYCPGRSSPWVSRGCLLKLGSGTKQQLGGGSLGGGMVHGMDRRCGQR